MAVRCYQSGALKWMEYRDGTFIVYLFVPSLRYEREPRLSLLANSGLLHEAGDRRTDLVFQSKRIARRRNTNVVAIAEMADGTRGAMEMGSAAVRTIKGADMGVGDPRVWPAPRSTGRTGVVRC